MVRTAAVQRIAKICPRLRTPFFQAASSIDLLAEYVDSQPRSLMHDFVHNSRVDAADANGVWHVVVIMPAAMAAHSVTFHSSL